MGSWAQLKGMPAPGHDNGADVGVVSKEEKEDKKAKDAKDCRFSYPILTIEEATVDGHGRPDDWDDVIVGYESGSAEADVGSEEMAGGATEEFGFNERKAEVNATPVKKARARPLLEQMLGRSRLKHMYEDDESYAEHPDMTPLRPSRSMSGRVGDLGLSSQVSFQGDNSANNACTTRSFSHHTLASLRRLSDHFPLRFDQRTSSRDIGSGRRSSVRYTRNSRFHLSGQKSSEVFNIDDVPSAFYSTVFPNTSGRMHIGLEKECFSASTSTAVDGEYGRNRSKSDAQIDKNENEYLSPKRRANG
ncbi:hypothetical protein CVT25_005273 [Psilocybe cyanescens]|uniref:Uncharacterized protein n=1 Tax=Psilocybe cyanescens TaxID=93625 RepID=A0A409XDW8_PSICY|nr:hypothetical protein CVT25_005273 [Psilocybe cyanescens]